MAKRADRFLDEHLLPLFNIDTTSNEHVVAVVSHGILLSNLWRRLLLRLPRRCLRIAPEVTAARGDLMLEHLGGWSNTGYLHLEIRKNDHEADPVTMTEESFVAETSVIPQKPISPSHEASAPPNTDQSKASEAITNIASSTGNSRILNGCSTVILAVDSKQHLVGLKRQRGGIGRSAHDESQKKLDGFFKKQRVA